ncbi:putative transcriptional regulator [marine actinobacterium PHSC20C1]|nr:putative transcriptional regulator [marine actinobacterium PHSC20C1]
MKQPDGRRVRGDATRRAVLDHAVQIASREGLDGLTLGTIAEVAGASKSGVATLFGSREQLQLAVVHHAGTIFTEFVVTPARAQPRGLPRLCALIERWTAQSEERLFEGGCFFLACATDFDSKPGLVRDALRHSIAQYEDYILAQITAAKLADQLPRLDDPEQLAFEIRAYYAEANYASLLHDSREPYRRAEHAIARRLLEAGAEPALVAQIGLGLTPAT